MAKKTTTSGNDGKDGGDGDLPPTTGMLDLGGSAPAKPYVVLARKYRPQTFDDLIGQEAHGARRCATRSPPGASRRATC